MLFRVALSGLLEVVINELLALDPGREELFAPLAGRVIAVNLTPPGRMLYFALGRDGIQVLEGLQGEPDMSLTGSPFAFARLMHSDSPARALFSGEVELRGDPHLSRQLQRLLERLELDWEEPLSRFTGDVVAHQVGNLVRAGQRWSRHTLNTFQMNLAEYLQEETRHLPARPEAEIYFEDVDRLRADCDRLEARLRRLESALGSDKG